MPRLSLLPLLTTIALLGAAGCDPGEKRDEDSSTDTAASSEGGEHDTEEDIACENGDTSGDPEESGDATDPTGAAETLPTSGEFDETGD